MKYGCPEWVKEEDLNSCLRRYQPAIGVTGEDYVNSLH